MTGNSKGIKEGVEALPPSVDLRASDSPIEDQGQLGSCTAHAVVGIAEHLQRTLHSQHIDASRRFLYKVTRSLLGWTGDTGAFLRNTIQAMRLFGLCPESFWPYAADQFDEEPTAFCYAFAGNYRAMVYYHLQTLEELKLSLAKGLPFAFGFTCFQSLMTEAVNKTGVIPPPLPGEEVVGGHAVAAVGYDDAKGALLIRNSWGTGWGEGGYGWLPYEYILQGLADDCWALGEMEFVELAT
jgi:C1A family cysteine protease